MAYPAAAAAELAPPAPVPGKRLDAESTEAGSGSDEEIATVAKRLVDVPRRQGLENMRLITERDTYNRYQAKTPELNFVLKSEIAFKEFVGMKYALAVNSGGIAITLGLEAIKRVLFPEEECKDIRVYSNAFTFNAVPSACVEAGFRDSLRLVEATEFLTIDLDHLEECICEDLKGGQYLPGKMILVLSYMRGRVPDMGRVQELCAKYDVKLLEDSAHGYGCSFGGKPCGSFGLVSTISSQANKLVNTGEGGMVFTNNDDMQAFFIFSAGSYEELWRKHGEMSPPEEVCLKYKYTVSNKSVRLSNIQAALMYPQLAVMRDRIDQHNAMYEHLVGRVGSLLEQRLGAAGPRRLEFIPQAHKDVGPVYDSLQVRIRREDGSVAEGELPGVDKFVEMLQGRKYSIAKFSHPANARNYASWQYLKPGDILPEKLPRTAQYLLNVCDLRLLCHDTEVEMDAMAADFVECFEKCFACGGEA